MGEMNGVRLAQLMSDANGTCSRVTAAVAYATPTCTFFDYCIENKIFVDFFGLLDKDAAVGVAVLEQLLKAGPLAVNARLVKGHFHSKAIWWHGFGAYIGSANLTSAAWSGCDSN
jgi:phosphatidylserine/phosphatidylglycerophosphate/cardiolipin synthase-like enzyme